MPFRSIRRKIFLSLSVATLVFGLMMIAFAQTVVRRELVDMLQEKGVVIARKVASDSVNHVITERYFEVTMMLRDLMEADPGIVYGYVVSEEGRDLAHTFTGGVPAGIKQANSIDPLRPFSVRELATEQGPVLDIGVPLLRGQIGALHLGLSLTAIRKSVNEIVVLIVVFGAVVMFAGIAAAVGFTNVITRPLVKLAGAAETFGRGGDLQPVAVDSDDEVGELARVFNEMMESRKRAEQEQTHLIEELRRTLAEVKTLRGFLPICSSCKKIRSDQGSWQQIEAYIRDHSDAEFSHGICPECAKKLYPTYWERMEKAAEP